MKNLLKNLQVAIPFLLLIILLHSTKTFSQWSNTSGSFPPGTFALNTAVQGNYIYAGVNNGVLISDMNSSNWTRILSNTGYIYSITFSGNSIFAGSSNGIYITSNGGTNWNIALSSSIWSMSSSAGNVYAVVWADRVYKTSDNGTVWTPVSPGGDVRCVAADEPYVYAGFYNYTSGGNGGVYVSQNSGANWIRTLDDINIYSIAFKNEIIYAGAVDDTLRTGGVYISTDHGMSWTRSSLDSVPVKTLFTYENYIFAGVDNTYYPGFMEYAGFWTSSDRGETWYKKNDGLPSSNTAVNSISVMNDNIYIAASDGGIWKRPLNQVIGIRNISSEIPSDFTLEQNYPNPFNPVTNLEFGIPELGFVSLKIYDVMGREIQTLVNERLAPGRYNYQFSTVNYQLPSGVYFYRLTAGEFTQIKRMMLVK